MSKNKILILTINHIWYDTRVYYKIVRSLLKKDVQIKLLTGNQYNNLPPPLRHCEVPHLKIPPKQSSGGGNNDFQYQIVPKRFRKIGMLAYYLYQGFRYKPDIVICIEPLSLLSGYVLKKILKCRYVYDNHEFYTEAFFDKLREHAFGKISAKLFSKLYWCFESYFAKKADAIITVNQILLEKYKTINQNVYLCANYLNREFFLYSDSAPPHVVPELASVLAEGEGGTRSAPPMKYEWGGEGGENNNSELRTPNSELLKIVYVGSLAFERGLKIYLKTAKLFKENDKNYTFLIIGNFKNKSTELYFFDYIKNHKLQNHIIYKPYMPNEKALLEIRNSNIGVFLGDVEQCQKYHKTTNMKVFEYYSQSIPVIVNRLNDLSKLINKSKGGWIIDFDSRALYILADKILNDDDLLKKKGNNGYKYTLENFVWEMQENELYSAVFGYL